MAIFFEVKQQARLVTGQPINPYTCVVHMSTEQSVAPVLSTPAVGILDDTAAVSDVAPAFASLNDDELKTIYEIDRTVAEIKEKSWTRIALQFPDDMLKDGPRVSELLHEKLSNEFTKLVEDDLVKSVNNLMLNGDAIIKTPYKVTILADTSYGSCCVDEIAAEHVDAQVVVHYGRTCLSPTARLPIVYVYTLKPLDIVKVARAFEDTYTDRSSNVVLLADLPYQGHVSSLVTLLKTKDYVNIIAPAVVHDPSAAIPNRCLPADLDVSSYSIFHISSPPDSLLLTLSSRVSSIYIFPVNNDSGSSTTVQSLTSSTSALFRRRYAQILSLSTSPIIGILINTLSVKSYLSVLDIVKEMITNAGKKYYTFVVGKINAAKIANFSDIGGWVVIGCWESSLVESKDFWKAVITPFELRVALMSESERIWGTEWRGDFGRLMKLRQEDLEKELNLDQTKEEDEDDGNASEDESEPPVYDFRLGRYVSQTRPMKVSKKKALVEEKNEQSTSLVKKTPAGELALMGGQFSPAADYLRSKRTWTGLGSDVEIEYQYDTHGKILGSQMEQGRSGIAKGYTVGDEKPGVS